MSISVHIPVSLLILAAILFPPLCAAGAADSSLMGSLNNPHARGAQRSMKMPPVIPDPIRNPGVKDWIPAYAGMTSYFHIKRIGESSQVLLVRNMKPASIDVRISPWERKNGSWRRPFAPLDGVIGRKGFAPPGEKREGDGRTPSGIFPLGTVFGYDPSFPTRMPYRQANVDDLWVDDVHADDYNRWVRRGTTQAASFEKMRRDDDLYKYGIVVEYNTNPVIKGQGSAIFFHLWRGKGISTAGCIALSEEDLIRILKWLDPAARPLVVMGTKATSEAF